MLIWENILLAFSGLKTNKLRTFLTMLGIVIGIAAVIAIMTVGDASNKAVMNSMGNMGANQINVYLTTRSSDMEGEELQTEREKKTQDYLSEEMLQTLLDNFSGRIKGFSLSNQLGAVEIEKKKGTNAKANLTGVNGGYLTSENIQMLAGRLFTSQEQENGKKVAVISDILAKDIFGSSEAAIGNVIEVVKGNRYFSYTVVGIYKYVQSSSDFSEAVPKTNLYIPLNTAVIQEKKDALFESFTAIAKADQDTAVLAEDIKSYLNSQYYEDNDTYQVYAYSMKAMATEMENMLNTQNIAFAAIAAISLLVGGIGVMNIMVVSITERTREIGTRKALGATNGSIRIQFIVEAIVICLLGGFIGVILGLVLGMATSAIMHYQGTPSVGGCIFCLVFSMFFGVFFGYYPANRAAKMNPIEALRHE